MDTSLITLTQLETELITKGFSSFTTYQKNQLVDELARKYNLAYTDITEQFIFNHHKNLKKELMSKVCSNAIQTGFTASNGHKYRTNSDDQLNMIAQKEFLNAFPETTVVKWKTVDAGYLDHEVEDWTKVYYEGFNYKMKVLFKYEKIKKMIELATADFELTAIDWDTFESNFPDTSPVPTPQPTTPETETPEEPTEKTPEETPEENTSTEQPTETEPTEDTTPTEEPTQEPTNEPTTDESTTEEEPVVAQQSSAKTVFQIFNRKK